MNASIVGWHFATTTLRDSRPLPHKDDVLKHDGKVVPCQSGLHASERALDALVYAPGPMVAQVRLSGTIVAHGSPVDKYAASEREYLTDYVDARRVLHEFACWCASRTLDAEEAAGRTVDPRSHKAIAVKLAWLDGKATDDELAAAGAAAWAARDAAWTAAWTARDAAGAAAWAARDAAGAAAWAEQNAELERRLLALMT
jgi:hypothetical protein